MKWLWRVRDGGASLDLDRLRLAFLIFAGVNAVTVAFMLAAEAATTGLALTGIAAMAALCGYWVYGYRHRFFWQADVLEGIAMAIAAISIGNAERAIGVFYVANFLRSLYDSPRRAMIRTLIFWASLSMALVATPTSMPLSNRIVPHIIGFVFTCILIQLVAKTVTQHERALQRERILRRLAIALAASATDHEAHVASVEAVRALDPADDTLRAVLAIGATEMHVVAASGSERTAADDGAFDLRAVPGPIRDALTAGQPVIRDSADGGGVGAALTFQPKPCAAVLPLMIDGSIGGVLVYGSDRALPPDLTSVLSIVAFQLSVWIARRAADDAARKSEEWYRALVQNSSDIFALVDEHATITYVSPSVEAIFGYKPDDLMGANGFDFIAPEDMQRVGELLLGCIADPSAHPTAVVRAYAVDGTERWIEAQLTNHLETDALRSIVVNARDVTERKSAEVERERHQLQVDAINAERARLLRHLVVAQEDERKLIAGDIHDDSVQKMSAAALRLGMLRKFVDDEKGVAVLEKLEESVTQSIDRLRKLMFSLRPPALDRDGLVAAIREQLAVTSEDAGFAFECSSSLRNEPSNEVRVTAFRIAQEALANIRKHAGANHVSVAIDERPTGVLVTITDDGVGFAKRDVHDSPAGHLGMTSMRERAELGGGWFQIQSSPGEGTTVRFLVRTPTPRSDRAPDDGQAAA